MHGSKGVADDETRSERKSNERSEQGILRHEQVKTLMAQRAKWANLCLTLTPVRECPHRGVEHAG